MKLTNQQVSALANKIKEEIVQPFKDYNENIYNSKEYKNFISEDKDCKELLKIANKYPSKYPSKNPSRYNSSCVESYIKNAMSEIKDYYFDDKLKKVPSISLGDLEQEIILGTIDCEGLDKLIETVKSKFNQSL